MAIMRFISRLILPKSSPFPGQRWLCTVAAETESAPQPNNRTLLFYQVVKADSDSSSVPNVLNDLVSQVKEVKRHDIIKLTGYLRNRKNFQAALKVYKWMESRNYTLTINDKAVCIDLLCKTEGVTSAENYFNALRDFEKTSKTYWPLLYSYCMQNLVEKAVNTFNVMKSLNFMTTLNYNNVLHLYYKMGKYEEIFSMVQEMEDNNLPLDVYTYNILINSHDALKNLDAIDAVFEKMKMKMKNVAHDLFTLGNLATIYFNSGLPEKAKACLGEMERTNAWPRKALLEAYRTRIKLHSQMNDLEGVLRAWGELKKAGPKPTNTSYLIMLLGLAKLGDQEGLEKIFNEWEKNNTGFDPRVPNVLLEYYLNRDMMEKANSLYKSLVERKKKPNLRSLDLFAALNVRNGDVDSGLLHLDMGLEMGKSRESNWFPSYETVGVFLKYFEENDDPEKAGRFAKRMKDLKRVDLGAALAGDTMATADAEICI